MQYKAKEYNPDEHDKFFALTVKQPWANDIVKAAFKDEYGTVYGVKSIEVRSRRTNYRGDILICSSKTPVLPGMQSGCTLGLVELYDCKPVSEFTDEDWSNTRIAKEKRKTFTNGYGWMLRNPRKVIEYPIKGQLGIYPLIYTKDEIIPYPEKVVLDKETYYKLKG